MTKVSMIVSPFLLRPGSRIFIPEYFEHNGCRRDFTPISQTFLRLARHLHASGVSCALQKPAILPSGEPIMRVQSKSVLGDGLYH